LLKKLLSSKPGRHSSESELHENMKPLNEKLRMRLTETNRKVDPDLAKRIGELYDGQEVRVTRAMKNRIELMCKTIDSIETERMNGDLQWIKDQLHYLGTKV